jgi:hypothetical protein
MYIYIYICIIQVVRSESGERDVDGQCNTHNRASKGAEYALAPRGPDGVQDDAVRCVKHQLL